MFNRWLGRTCGNISDRKILILEDNRDRQTYMAAHLADVLVISLDHDLEFKPGRNGKAIDPGTGRDVVNHLVDKPPCCPIIVATTNSTADDEREFALREAHWNVRRVFPYGDLEWIPTQWFRAMRDAIVGSVLPRGVAVR